MMKKFFLCLFTISVLLSSCTTLNEVEENIVPLKRLVKVEINDGSFTSVLDYIYENDLLKQIKYQNFDASFDFKYDQGKIIEVKSPGDIANSYTSKYEYKDDKISKETGFSDDELTSEDEYTYGVNNELQTVKRISYIFSNGIKTPYNSIDDYEYNASNNSVKAVDRDNNQNYTTTIYDNRNNPYLNESYYLPLIWINGNASANNILEIKQYSDGELLRSDSHSYEFDSDDFITKETVTETYFNSASTDTEITTYKYFYNK